MLLKTTRTGSRSARQSFTARATHISARRANSLVSHVRCDEAPLVLIPLWLDDQDAFDHPVSRRIMRPGA